LNESSRHEGRPDDALSLRSIAPDPERLLNAGEVAALLGVPESWVRQETRAGRMPHLPLGRYRRYQRAEVLAWLETLQSGQWRRNRPRAVA
jgi:excisionase family DNA binding protein